MATFDVWDNQQHKVTGTIELNKEDIDIKSDMSCRTNSNPPFRGCTAITKKDGTELILACPMGEVDDRLNDADATAPSAFESPDFHQDPPSVSEDNEGDLVTEGEEADELDMEDEN